MKERTFTEEQIQALLKRATELHIMDEVDDGPSLTLTDLEHIAADAGLPPKYLRAALHEADHQVSTHDVSGQTKTHAFIERTIPGELTDTEWEAVVFRLRKEYASDLAGISMGSQYGTGVIEQLGNTREWRHTSALGVVTTLTIRSVEGKQHVTFQRRVGLASTKVEGFGYGLLIALIAGAIAGGISSSVLALLIVFMVALALAVPSIQYADRRWRENILHNMKGVTEDIARLVQTSEQEEERASAEQVVAANTLGDPLDAHVDGKPRLLDVEGLDHEEPHRSPQERRNPDRA